MTRRGTWREHARPIIAKALADTMGMGETAIRKALREAYPYGERAHHPYKIWLSEIAVQRKKKKIGRRSKPTDPGQCSLF